MMAVLVGAAGWVGRQAWIEAASHFSVLPFQGQFTESFEFDQKGEWAGSHNWSISAPLRFVEWPPTHLKAGLLSGPVTMSLRPERFESSRGILQRRSDLQDFSLTLEFKFQEGGIVGFLVHAQPDSRGQFRDGHLIQLRLADAPSRPGFRRFESLGMRQLRPGGTDQGLDDYKTATVPRLPSKPTDWYSLQIRAKDDQLDFWIKVLTAETGRQGTDAWQPFQPFKTTLSKGGTVGLQLESGNSIVLNQLRLVAPGDESP